MHVHFVGTSLTEGYGLPSPEEAFPGRVQSFADSAGYPVEVVNAGVSGETSSGTLSRIDWLLSRPVDILVLEVGANDGLRGVDPAELERNLRAIVEVASASRPDASILLLAMEAPPNLGESYRTEFRNVFQRVGEDPAIVPGPFLLEEVAAVWELNQADGIHPTAAGHEIVARTVWTVLEPLIAEAAAGRTSESNESERSTSGG